MTHTSIENKQRYQLKPELVSAVSGAVFELQRVLSSVRRPYEWDYRSGSLTAWTQASTQASAFELQRFAKESLASVRAQGEATPTGMALEAFESVLRSLVVDNGPTPQVAATPSGSMEIQWLVGGVLISALFDETGDCYVLAVDEAEEVLLDTEFPVGPVPEALQADLGALLHTMSDQIVKRPHSWSSRGEWR